jgi:hypothetical protein
MSGGRVDPHTKTAIVARGYRVADLALATTPGAVTVGEMTQAQRDLLEIGILAGMAAYRGHLADRKARR